MSGVRRRHYVAGSEHHTVLLEDKLGGLRARIDHETNPSQLRSGVAIAP